MLIASHYLALLPVELAKAFRDDGPALAQNGTVQVRREAGRTESYRLRYRLPAVGEGEKRRQRSIALPTPTVVFAVEEILKSWRARAKAERECRVATDKAATDGTRDLRCCRQRFVAQAGGGRRRRRRTGRLFDQAWHEQGELGVWLLTLREPADIPNPRPGRPKGPALLTKLNRPLPIPPRAGAVGRKVAVKGPHIQNVYAKVPVVARAEGWVWSSPVYAFIGTLIPHLDVLR